MRITATALAAGLLASACTNQPPQQPMPVAVQAPLAAPASGPPPLLIVISVDQLSSELFEAYRPHFTDGLARLARGAVYVNGYQAHAATETCPGHSTLLTGRHPAATGIPANGWIDQSIARDDKHVNCAEDESVAGSTSRSYTVSPAHLRAPTLAEILKARFPASKVVAVAGKDRSAVMTTGRAADQRWYWHGDRFVTDLASAPVPASLPAANQVIANMIAGTQPALVPPPLCQGKAKRYQVGDQTIGDGRFERAAGDIRGFRASPAFDGATLALAAALAQDLKLGTDSSSDLLSIGLAGTDIIGHALGTGGQEMCLQMLSLDRDLGDFFRTLDAAGIDYAVALTADHGAMDMPERLREQGIPAAARADAALDASAVGRKVAGQLGLNGPVLLGDLSGDVWLDRALGPQDRVRALAAAVSAYRAHPQVEAVFTAAEVLAVPVPTEAPDRWSLLQRVRASWVPGRSGDFYVILKRHVTPNARPSRGYVAGHGTPWDYDRRIPILFWRRGMTAADHGEARATVDILPTLAAMMGLAVPSVDGRCIDSLQSVRCPS